MPKSSPPSQGWDDTSHHRQRCSWRSQRHRTSGCPYRKPRAEVPWVKELCCSSPLYVEHFIPQKSVLQTVHPPPSPTPLGWSILLSCVLTLRCWCRTSAAGVRAAAVRRDRRGHYFTFIGGRCFFFPHPGSHPCESPSRGGQGEAKDWISIS